MVSGSAQSRPEGYRICHGVKVNVPAVVVQSEESVIPASLEFIALLAVQGGLLQGGLRFHHSQEVLHPIGRAQAAHDRQIDGQFRGQFLVIGINAQRRLPVLTR